MIAFLRGRILEKTNSFIIVEHGGIGYKVFTVPDILAQVIGGDVILYTYMKVSDDGQSLYGLPSFADLQFFELLISVSGVGPKGALGIMGSAKRELIEQAISNQDAAVFTKIAGIGKKTAERIIVELKNKVGVLPGTHSPAAGTSDILDGLLALGYRQHEINAILPEIDASLSTEQKLKMALKLLSRK